MHVEMPLVGHAQEARRAGEQACAWMALYIERPEQHEGQLREEALVLLRHGVANEALANRYNRVAEAGAVLDRQLSGMKDRHRWAQVAAAAGMATKPGSASIRASQARRCA